MQTHFTAVTVSNAARNTQAKAVALLLPGQTKMGFENLLQALFRDARPLVVHSQGKGMLIVFNALHWKRHGTLDWGDARASLFVLLAYLAVSLVLEFARLRGEERAAARSNAGG